MLIGIAVLAVCTGASAQGESFDAVKAQIAERLANLETYSADTSTRLNMGAISFTVKGTVRGKGAMSETTTMLDLFSQKMFHRTVIDAVGVRWEESDMMGEKSVSKLATSADADTDPVRFGMGSIFGAEPIEPRSLLDNLAVTYDLAAKERTTLDGAEVFVVEGRLNADELEDLTRQTEDVADMEFVGGFVEGMITSFMHVRAYFGVADGFPRKLEMLREDGTPTLAQTFSNILINHPIDDAVFAYTPPDGVEVQDRDVVTATSAVHVGDAAPQFDVIALDGSSLALEDYKGKVVLLDFWATWCGPCIVELPNVIALYEEFHPKGLELIGISLDGDRAKVEAFIKENPGMAWPQIFDGNAWEAEVAELYGVEAIPLTVLIGKDGAIIGLDLHGEALEAAVAEALGIAVEAGDGEV